MSRATCSTRVAGATRAAAATSNTANSTADMIAIAGMNAVTIAIVIAKDLSDAVQA